MLVSPLHPIFLIVKSFGIGNHFSSISFHMWISFHLFEKLCINILNSNYYFLTKAETDLFFPSHILMSVHFQFPTIFSLQDCEHIQGML